MKFLFDLGKQWGIALPIDLLYQIKEVKIYRKLDQKRVSFKIGDTVYESHQFKNSSECYAEYERMMAWANGYPSEKDVEAATKQANALKASRAKDTDKGTPERLQTLIRDIMSNDMIDGPYMNMKIEYDHNEDRINIDFNSNDDFDEVVTEWVGYERVGGMTPEQKVIIYCMDALTDYARAFSVEEDLEIYGSES